MPAISNALWALGLILQLSLLALLIQERRSLRLPLFTALIGFYTLRAVFLFTALPYISRASYVDLYQVLALIDLLLQAAVAVEIVRALMPPGRSSPLRSALPLPASVILAAGLTLLLTMLLPAHSPVPVDRVTVFAGFLFLELLAWAATLRLRGPARSVLGGLAAVGAASILSQAGKTLAAIHHATHAFADWSYFSAAVYLLVLAAWNLALWKQPAPRLQRLASIS